MLNATEAVMLAKAVIRVVMEVVMVLNKQNIIIVVVDAMVMKVVMKLVLVLKLVLFIDKVAHNFTLKKNYDIINYNKK